MVTLGMGLREAIDLGRQVTGRSWCEIALFPGVVVA